MKQLMKKGMSLLLAFVLILGLVPAISLTADAATVNYRYSGSYIYNWGTREEVATFLSPNAEDFYEENNVTYAELAVLSGSSKESSVPSSALYKELASLMSGAQTKQTSYNGTRDLFQYTDCENNGSPSTISSFYSGIAIGPSWDGGNTWNREHTWPNSKGDKAGNGENDIMMLRPASVKENSSRGNKAYGESGDYYNPNGMSNGKHDLRGDVARIVLYVYVRWGCTNTGSGYNPNGIFGTKGVIESKELLLDWVEEDPVDTWELGRNDSVESITGTRNVFVDFPELAFLLFDEQVPAMQTPSGSGGQTPDTGITIDSQPVSLTVDEGEVANFTVAATGTKLTYQWQYRTSETDTWKNSPATGNKTATLSVPGTLSRNGYQYRCVITNGSGSSLYSDAATLNVKEEVLTGWVEEGGAWCYYVDGQKLTNDWAMDSAGWYYMGADGYAVKNAWTKDSSGWYYMGADGRAVKDTWVMNEGGWMYIGSNKHPVTNDWAMDSAGWYFMGADGYAVKNAWTKDSSGWYYMDSTGRAVKNTWVMNEGGWMYIGSDKHPVTNDWAQDSAGWYFMGADGYAVKNGWTKDSSGWYYMDSTGRAVKNTWAMNEGGWMYIGSDKHPVTNTWAQDSAGWYYMGADGYAVKNAWTKDSSGWFYMGADGRAVKNGWAWDSAGRLYMGADGHAVKNQWITVDGVQYYADANGYIH